MRQYIISRYVVNERFAVQQSVRPSYNSSGGCTVYKTLRSETLFKNSLLCIIIGVLTADAVKHYTLLPSLQPAYTRAFHIINSHHYYILFSSVCCRIIVKEIKRVKIYTNLEEIVKKSGHHGMTGQVICLLQGPNNDSNVLRQGRQDHV